MDRVTLIEVIAVTIAGPGDEPDTRTPADFDLEAIADELHREAGGWDIQDLEPAVFWATVEKHARRSPR